MTFSFGKPPYKPVTAWLKVKVKDEFYGQYDDLVPFIEMELPTGQTIYMKYRSELFDGFVYTKPHPLVIGNAPRIKLKIDNGN